MIFVIRILFLSGCFIMALFFALSLFRGRRHVKHRIRRALGDDS